jgi:hypothetical protein
MPLAVRAEPVEVPSFLGNRAMKKEPCFDRRGTNGSVKMACRRWISPPKGADVLSNIAG